MFRSLFSDLVALPYYLIKPDFLAKWRLKWQGPRPTLAMLLKFYRDSDLAFHKNLRLRLLDFKAIKKISETTSFFHQQEVEKNSDHDQKLLRSSTLAFYPHEVTQVRIINAQKVQFYSQVYHGGPYQGLDAISLKSIIRKLCFKARQKGLTIEEVEIAHTHPALEVMVTNNTKKNSAQSSTFFFNGLSKADKMLAQDIAPFVDYPLRIKAISPVANYSCLY